MMRQTVCDGTCKEPGGIDNKYVAIYQNGGQCEISVAVSATTELFVNRDTWPEANDEFETIWQQCWDSTQTIIDKCVSEGARVGWWNGNHVYQFHKAGARPLNDPDAHHTQSGMSLSSYLMPSTDGLNCEADCRGYIPNPQWCNDNCGLIERRGILERAASRSVGAITPRKTEGVTDVGGCKLSYVLPDYPSSGSAQSLSAVQKFYDRDDSVTGNNNCNNPRLVGPVAKVAGSSYDTEHVFEKHIIKRFLYFLIGGPLAFSDDPDPDKEEPVATCEDVKKVFDSTNPKGTHFRTETAAQQLGKAVSCSGSNCPDANRLNEFFLLRSEINGFKNRIFTGHSSGPGFNPNDDKLPRCNNTKIPDPKQMQQQMILGAMVFQYMNRQEVFDAFNAVHARIQAILDNLDQDDLGKIKRPRKLHLFGPEGGAETWLGAYNEFMVRFLEDSERKMDKWLYDCKNMYYTATSNDQDARRKVSDYESSGVYSAAAFKLSDIWTPIKGDGQT
ncbi:hypothetical protein SLS62_007529 [Diatrype stigma]|uniref:Uncharacterized protein n=1 Tax=Diatrype stigma TaxID=117547 RepID=A0AAN9UN31_9PEZI